MFESVTSTIVFWAAWGVISALVLGRFYFSYQAKAMQAMRWSAAFLEILLLALLFLPWLPTAVGGASGFELMMGGRADIIVYTLLLVIAAVIFFGNFLRLIPTAAIIHLFTSVYIFFVMIRLLPGTFTLELRSVAPIISALLLLVGNVVVLMLWQQWQLRRKTQGGGE